MSFDDIQQHEDEAGITRSQAYVHSLIAKEIEKGIPSERIVLGGFSQGGAMSLMSGVTAPTRLGGIFGLSCYLLLRGKLRDMVPSESPNKVYTIPRIEIEHLTLHIYIMLIWNSKPQSSWAMEMPTRLFVTNGARALLKSFRNGVGMSTSRRTRVFLTLLLPKRSTIWSDTLKRESLISATSLFLPRPDCSNALNLLVLERSGW